MKRIDCLQAGRAIAAFIVVIHHAALAAKEFAAPLPGQFLWELGYLGVDFFFVLSGFIIYETTVDRGRTSGEYFWARFWRVMPTYWPVGIFMALAYTFVPALSAGSREWDWLATIFLVPLGSPALSVAWTLQHEILFYVIFGLLYFTGWLKPGLLIWGALIVGATALGFKSIPFAIINLEFLMGIAVAIAWRRGLTSTWTLAIAPLAVGLWWAMGAQRDHSTLIGLALAACLPPLIRWERDGRYTVPKSLIFLGAASYALYVVHVPIISATSRLVDGHWMVLGLGIAASMVGSIAYYFAVEGPAKKASHLFYRRFPQTLRRDEIAA